MKRVTKSVSVMLDADIAEALGQMREKIIRQMNDSGIYGSVAAPTLGYLARSVLRSKFGLQDNEKDSHVKN